MSKIPVYANQYDVMKSWERDYAAIYVTGPHLSGCGLVGSIVCHETSRSGLFDESFFLPENRKRFASLRSWFGVICCPSMMRWIHEDAAQGHPTRKNLVVVVVRDLLDIYRSEERHGWRGEMAEMAKYTSGRPAIPAPGGGFANPTLLEHQKAVPDDSERAGDLNIPRSAEIKYYFWQSTQKPLLADRGIDWVELNYENMADHPLWLPREKR